MRTFLSPAHRRAATVVCFLPPCTCACNLCSGSAGSTGGTSLSNRDRGSLPGLYCTHVRMLMGFAAGHGHAAAAVDGRGWPAHLGRRNGQCARPRRWHHWSRRPRASGGESLRYGARRRQVRRCTGHHSGCGTAPPLPCSSGCIGISGTRHAHEQATTCVHPRHDRRMSCSYNSRKHASLTKQTCDN